MTNKMKAAIRNEYCSPDEIKIEDIKVPQPNDNELQIKVYASTVNRTDCANLSAVPFIMRFVIGFLKPRKPILGTDFAGEIVAVGKSITAFKEGDRVFGFDDMGSNSHAEYLTITEIKVFNIPKNIEYKEAAASLEGAHYAYTSIHKAKLKTGQKILINGATGAIGSALLQFVRKQDVEITVTSNTKNIHLMESLGADKVVDYTTQDFTDTKEKYDYIFDAVGKSTFGKCKPLLKQKGVYISSELGPYAQNIFYPIITYFTQKKVLFPIPYQVDQTIPYIISFLETKQFKPVIDKEYPLSEISKAYKYVSSGQKTGNVLVSYEDITEIKS